MIIRKPSHQIQLRLQKIEYERCFRIALWQEKIVLHDDDVDNIVRPALGGDIAAAGGTAAPEPGCVNWLNHPDFVTVRAELIEEGEL